MSDVGHYCRICGRSRPNEAFTGGGHRIHVCRRCQRRPKEERDSIEQQDEIFGFLEQSHISDKNVSRLTVLAESKNAKTAEYAQLVLEVAKVKPHKRRRLKVLAKERPDLLKRLAELGFIYDGDWPGPDSWLNLDIWPDAEVRPDTDIWDDAERWQDASGYEDVEIPF